MSAVGIREHCAPCIYAITTPCSCHENIHALDASNRIVFSREVRRAAGIPQRQKLLVSATRGRIVLEMEANPAFSLDRPKVRC